MKTIREPLAAGLFRIECSNRDCMALMEVEKHELRQTSDRNESFWVMECPHCHKETWISDLEKYNVMRTDAPVYRGQGD